MRRITIPAILAAAFLVSTMAPPAEAVTIPFSNADLVMSTSSVGGNDIPPAGLSPALIPASGTFTQPFNSIFVNAAWYRFSFSLPAGFTNVSTNIRLSVDNEAQLFLNGQTAAIESDFTVDNFNPPFPGFTLNPNGTVTDNSSTWNALPISQAMFQVGANELIFLAVDAGDGTIGFTLDLPSTNFISYDVDGLAPVPEPATLLLFGTTLAGLGLTRWKRRRNS
jgi:hypothetical protein